MSAKAPAGPSSSRRPVPIGSVPPAATTASRASRSRSTQAAATVDPVAHLRVEEPQAISAVDLSTAVRIDADIAQLNLSFLHVARELARSARELAVTRLGLDAAACAALDRLSVADLQALAHSHALVFALRVDPTGLQMQAELARTNRIASGARLLLAADAG